MRHSQEHPLTLPRCSSVLLLEQIHAAALVSRYTDLIIAGTTVDRAIILWQEWNLCLRTALSANNSVHLSWSTFGSSTRTARRIATRCTTGRTTTGLIHQSFLLVEFLLTSGEHEIVTALTTL